ncbi:Sec-independent protein translocase subunit TatA [Actinocrispum wychmicini]|uniref:Sec-independent protein translocase protein TatA n=1 Tax=Actinocrispum wychmicini TaxID=1213861 RepID=A0A4R2JHC4_9PSEU|nr:Sec-independent protein translocase subunit TatA [Actinocrispum wychmicini]TCO53545.1 sec-independent protein translocase protein TatA [Actinocrispum wychmicini]
MPNLGATELIIIAVVVILLFGAKKMPDMARSLGRSMRIIKAETKGLRQDGQDGEQDAPVAKAAPAPPAQLPEAQQPSDIDKMQKQIDELQAQLKSQHNSTEPSQAQKNAS